MKVDAARENYFESFIQSSKLKVLFKKNKPVVQVLQLKSSMLVIFGRFLKFETMKLHNTRTFDICCILPKIHDVHIQHDINMNTKMKQSNLGTNRGQTFHKLTPHYAKVPGPQYW